MARRTQRAPIKPMSTHGKMSHIVSPSLVRSEGAVKNLFSQLLLAVLCREAEIPIHTAAIEKAATVIRACRVLYLLKIRLLSCVRMNNQGHGQGRMPTLAAPIKPSICIKAPI